MSPLIALWLMENYVPPTTHPCCRKILDEVQGVIHKINISMLLFHLKVQKYWKAYTSIKPSVQSLSHVWLFVTSWTAARQASLSIINCRSLLKFMSIASVMPSNHLILCHPLLLPPSIFPSIGVIFNELILYIRWPKDWSFSFSMSPSNGYSELISFRMD